MKKAAILTYGCTNNLHEAELISGLLQQEGYTIIDDEKKADFVVVNMCTVKTPTENKIIKKIKEISEKGIPLLISGCVPTELLPELKKISPNASIINTHNIKHIAKAAEKTLAGEKTYLLEKRDTVKICMPKKRKNSVISIIPICSGCNGSCTYCSVRLIKGKLFSYPQLSILKEAEKSLQEGCKEIWITSQDNAAYEYNLATLLKKILSLPYDFRLRLGMMDPNNVIKILNSLIEVYQHEKMFKFLHIPVQSGNDEVLKKMNRQYSVEEFKEIIVRFRKKIPDITVSTDIICGFPSETEKQFEDTINLIKEIKPDVLNISRFWLRPGTAASKMKQLSGAEIKKRSQKLSRVFRDIVIEKNKKWLGWSGNVIIDEIGKDSTFVARNDFYKPIIIPFGNSRLIKTKPEIGQRVKVRIKEITQYDLRI